MLNGYGKTCDPNPNLFSRKKNLVYSYTLSRVPTQIGTDHGKLEQGYS